MKYYHIVNYISSPYLDEYDQIVDQLVNPDILFKGVRVTSENPPKLSFLIWGSDEETIFVKSNDYGDPKYISSFGSKSIETLEQYVKDAYTSNCYEYLSNEFFKPINRNNILESLNI